MAHLLVVSSTVECGKRPVFCVVSTSQSALSRTERLWDDVCSVSPLPPSSCLSPTSSSSHLSFSICLSSCNISVWPFHPLSLLCPDHLVWKPPPPFLHFSISLHLEGSLFPRGESDCLSDLSSRTILCPPLILLWFGLLFDGQKMVFVLWDLERIYSTDQLRDLKENVFVQQRDKSCWRDYIWFEAVITGSFVSAHLVALNCACQSPCFCLHLSAVQWKKRSRVV